MKHTPSRLGALTNPCVSTSAAPEQPPLYAGAATIIADASKVFPRDFLDFVTGDTRAKREQRLHEDRQRCIRAIERGDTYGFPPVMVEECKRLIAEDDAALIYVERIAPGKIAL